MYIWRFYKAIIHNPEPHAEVEIMWFVQIAKLSVFMETSK